MFVISQISKGILHYYERYLVELITFIFLNGEWPGEYFFLL